MSVVNYESFKVETVFEIPVEPFIMQPQKLKLHYNILMNFIDENTL